MCPSWRWSTQTIMIDKAIMTYIQGSTGCTAVPLLPYKKPNRWELGTKQRDSTTSLLLLPAPAAGEGNSCLDNCPIPHWQLFWSWFFWPRVMASLLSEYATSLSLNHFQFHQQRWGVIIDQTPLPLVNHRLIVVVVALPNARPLFLLSVEKT